MFELETGLIFWNTVSFAILVFLMYKWVIPPIVGVLKDRQKAIGDSIAAAEDSRKRSEAALAENKKKLAEADRTAKSMVELAKSDGERMKKEILEKAEKQAGLIAEKAEQDMQAEKARIVNEAKKEIADLVAMAAGRVIGRVINKDDNSRIIEESLR
ncbi:MAG TPA: F0F1 ATP synthase subunit B [Candidatus Omnitrophota bacterium]|nr:F0F1 ATP synthase subunit B [Candidatus Omnitrophota bacterium]